MATIEQLRRIANEFTTATDTPLKTVSSRIFDDGKRLVRIVEGGSDLTTAGFDHAMQWFSANWPVGQAWPSDIPRPAEQADAEGQSS